MPVSELRRGLWKPSWRAWGRKGGQLRGLRAGGEVGRRNHGRSRACKSRVTMRGTDPDDVLLGLDGEDLGSVGGRVTVSSSVSSSPFERQASRPCRFLPRDPLLDPPPLPFSPHSSKPLSFLLLGQVSRSQRSRSCRVPCTSIARSPTSEPEPPHEQPLTPPLHLSTSPTRMALTNTKTQLKGAQTGHSLLAKKRDALMTRFRAILKKVDEVRRLPFLRSALPSRCGCGQRRERVEGV